MNNFTIENLNDPIFINNLDDKVNKIEFFNDTKEALYLSRDIEKFLLKNEENIKDIKIVKIIKIIISKLKFILFNTLDESEIFNIFSKYLSIGISMAYVDLGESLKMRISFIPIDKRDEFKEKIRKIIINNQEEITQKTLIDSQARVRPTIANWVKLYNRELGTGPINNLEQNKFYISNANFISLSELEKLELKELFSVYEYLKRSSMTIEGNEDDMVITDTDNKNYWFRDGKFIVLGSERRAEAIIQKEVSQIKQKNIGGNNIDELTNLAAQYPVGSFERKAIEEEMKKLEVVF